MHNSKLLKFLKILNATELKRLHQFLKSPFFNKNPHLLKLYQILRVWYPDFNSPKLEREKIFKKLFPDRAYDYQKLLNLISDFTNLLKQYLQILQLEKEKQVQDELLIKAYSKRAGAYDVFIKQIEKTKKELDAQPYRNADFFRQKFWLNQIFINHPKTDKFQLSSAKYNEMMQQLDYWFLLEKLLVSCEMKAREKPLSEKHEIWLLPEIQKGVPTLSFEDPIFKVYLEMLELLEKGEEGSYFRLKKWFLENLSKFTRLQQQNILQSLINYSIQRGNKGEALFIKENLNLYQFGLSENLFVENGILNDMMYISIVNVALRTGASNWCFEFINEYKPYLENRKLKDASSLATALWLHAVRQPEEVIKLLQKVDFHNVYYQIQTRVLLIKVYFEAFQNDEAYADLILYQTSSFERYLRRNKKISDAQKVALLNFVFSVRRLLKLKKGNEVLPKTKLKIKQELEEVAPLYNHAWLFQQVE